MTVLAMPHECFDDYMRQIAQHLDVELWTVIDGVLIDAVSGEPVSEVI
jgi:hypothetical protein